MHEQFNEENTYKSMKTEVKDHVTEALKNVEFAMTLHFFPHTKRRHHLSKEK